MNLNSSLFTKITKGHLEQSSHKKTSGAVSLGGFSVWVTIETTPQVSRSRYADSPAWYGAGRGSDTFILIFTKSLTCWTKSYIQ